MHNISKHRLFSVICILFVFACIFTGCQVADEGVTINSSLDVESSEDELKNSTKSSESSTSNTDSSAAYISSQEESQFITPNPDIPVEEIPQPDSQPDIKYESNSNTKYESERITLSLNGDSEVVVISDDTAKTTILEYVDGMKESSYNAENTPPGAGYTFITVAVHRQGNIEEYIFTDYTADGNSLGKNLQKS